MRGWLEERTGWPSALSRVLREPIDGGARFSYVYGLALRVPLRFAGSDRRLAGVQLFTVDEWRLGIGGLHPGPGAARLAGPRPARDGSECHCRRGGAAPAPGRPRRAPTRNRAK